MPKNVNRPYAITMWDFSWVERRWPGAGYEDWDQALDELAERGYDAVRIDAFPHLLSADPDRLWTVLSCGQTGDWGSPSEVDVHVGETLVEFMSKCRDRNIMVGLSTWYKQDPDDVRMNIRTPLDQARIWVDTLDHISKADLLDTVLYVDLCNEFPNVKWAPYLYGSNSAAPESLASERLISWMAQSVSELRKHYPQLDYTFSFSDQFEQWDAMDVSMLDFLEPHIWMAHWNLSSFCEEIGYLPKSGSPDFQAIVRRGKPHYLANKERYDKLLTGWIDKAADWSRATGKPLMTTECWSLINYKDWPMIEWDWIKDICALGVETAAGTGRWTAIATSNFCGPQYVGMWRDIAWHKRMTDIIKTAPIDSRLTSSG